MTFEFFNSSRLAFGQKLTKAFDTLDKQLNSADLHIDTILKDLKYYNKYTGQNYESPTPHRAEMPARVDEVLDIVKNVSRVDMSWSGSKFSVRMAVIVNGKPTICYGETTNKSGYAFAKPTSSYTELTSSIRFNSSSSAKRNGEVYLFRYRIDRNGHIILINSVNSFLPAAPYDETRYTSMSIKSLTVSASSTSGYRKFTATEPMAIIWVKPNVSESKLYLRGKLISYHGSNENIEQPVVLYLQKGDVVEGSYKAAYEIVYNIKNA